MSYKELIKEEIERLKRTNGVLPVDNNRICGVYRARGYQLACDDLLQFIDSFPEEPDREGDLKAKSENKNFEEIDKYCTLCMDINCFGCQYHDIHFRNFKNIIKNDTIH